MEQPPASTGLDLLPKITGSFSSPARLNPTYLMVESAYVHHGIHARYLNCEVSSASLRDAVEGARAMGWIGFGCSMPHKVAIIQHLDGLGKSASLIGAVNCVVNRDGRLIGENTDGIGFLRSLKAIVDPMGVSLVLLGAGGAARAIAIEAALAGVRSITVVNRQRKRGEELTHLICENTPAQASFAPWDKSYSIPPETEIVVNATSVGFHPDVDALVNIDPETLHPPMIVADVVPNPPRTPLLRQASSRGCTTLDGLGMLVYQGVASIQYWTGISVEPSIMRETMEKIFGVKRN